MYTHYVVVGSETAAERLNMSVVDTIISTVRQSGFFGEGLGTASLGARFGGALGIETWQESGPGRLIVELGVLGFIAALAFVGSVGWTLFQMLKAMPRNSEYLPYYAGLIGLLAANGASFTISHQLFGDPFIIILTGFFVGITLSVPLWSNRFQEQPVAAPRLAYRLQ
jgi:hypothetical protein